MNELKDMLKSPCAILRLSRLPRFSNGVKENSLAIKIDFEGQTLPTKVKLVYVSFVVEEFNRPPIRCYQCQRFGHMSGGCTAKMRCLICGDEHQKSDCPNSQSSKCANCKEVHVASSRKCIYNKKSVEISNLIRKGSSFSKAKKLIDGKYKENPPPVSLMQNSANRKDKIPSSSVNNERTFSDVVREKPPEISEDTTWQNECKPGSKVCPY